MTRKGIGADYYQQLHDQSPAFQGNNWLLADLESLRGVGGESILELGCGNGLFLEQAAASWSRVAGLDWARSPVLEGILARCPNVSFEQADVLAWQPRETFDIVASADFLEHLPPELLPVTLQRIHGFGRAQFHRIACYDDGHSHLSIYPPEQWLALFAAVDPAYRLLSSEPRKGNPANLVITIGTIAAGHGVTSA